MSSNKLIVLKHGNDLRFVGNRSGTHFSPCLACLIRCLSGSVKTLFRCSNSACSWEREAQLSENRKFGLGVKKNFRTDIGSGLFPVIAQRSAGVLRIGNGRACDRSGTQGHDLLFGAIVRDGFAGSANALFSQIRGGVILLVA